MKGISVFLVVLVNIFVFAFLCGAYLEESSIEYILKNYKDKDFYYLGKFGDGLWVVSFEKPLPVKVYIKLAKSRSSDVMNMINVYASIEIFDKKPSSDLMEYLLRQNNFLEGWGSFYIYYDVNVDKWFVDYVVKIRQNDITRESLLHSVKYVRLFTVSAREKIKELKR